MHRATSLVFKFIFILPLLVSTTAVFAKLPPPAPTDMRVLIDISGSMKQNDPNNLRIPALKLLLNLMPQDCNAGVWTFGRYVNMLVPYRAVSPKWKKMAKQEANKINYAGQFTNIGSAIEKASFGWRDVNPESQRSMILLTDGMVDVSRSKGVNENERNKILNVLLPQLKKAGVKIHTIALSKNADIELLQTLALSTDGQFAIVNNAEELLKVFVAAFDQSVEQEQVPIEGNQFSIDGSVDEFTVLIYRKPTSIATQLKMPNGQVVSQNDKLTGLNWFSDSRYDLITIASPIGGEWTLLADVDPDNRVTVVSDLKLFMEGVPTNIVKSEVLDMSVFLSEGDSRIVKSDFLSLLDITFRQDFLDGDKTWEGKLTSHKEGKVKTPRNGTYSARLNKTLLPGRHELTVLVDGKTFQRKKKQKLTVHSEVLEVLIVEEESENGMSNFYLNILPKGGIVPKGELEVSAVISSPTKILSEPAVTSTAFGGWRVDVKGDAGAGVYSVTLTVKSSAGSARHISLVQGPYKVEYRKTSTPSSEVITEIGADSMVVQPVIEEPVPEKIEPEKESPKPEMLNPEEEVALEEELKIDESFVDDTEEEEPIEEEYSEDESDDSLEEESGFEEESESFIEMITNMDKRVLGGIVAGINLVVFGFGYVVYRKVMSRKDLEDEADDLDINLSGLGDDNFDLSEESEGEGGLANEETVVVQQDEDKAAGEEGLSVDDFDEEAEKGTDEVAVVEDAGSDEFDLEADLAELVEDDTEVDITLDDIEEKLSGAEEDTESEDDDLSL
ncbi:MAG: VWA domain-containing protein [Pseudomonadales bacterium]|nr:VWA domain-containing protein [Pseudomonadales bacterium]